MGSLKSGNRTRGKKRKGSPVAKPGGVPLNCRSVHGTEVFDRSTLDKTKTVSLALELLDCVINSAHLGDTQSIAMLKDLRVEVIEQRIEPITVLRADDEVAVWIV